MLIGNQYADNKVYRGIRHYDTLPLTSGDLHEYSDTVYMKNAYIMNNIVGYGTLNRPRLSLSSNGIRLEEPAVVMINGDVSLINTDDGNEFIEDSKLSAAGYQNGIVCIVGWYQHITSNDTMRNYGGVENSVIDNDLMNPEIGMQISTRYQFRWCKIIVADEDFSRDSLIFSIDNRDKDGNITTGTTQITTNRKIDNVFIADIPANMDYALENLYIVPIIEYIYEDTLQSAVAHLPISKSNSFIESRVAPHGSYSNGTIWYNPDSREFKNYVNGSWISSASTMAFLQYQSIHVMEDTITTPSSITIPINISEFQEGDILLVNYEGLVLSPIEQYDIDYENKTITLIQFTSRAGDRVYFTATKIVEASDITNVTLTFNRHMSTRANDTVEGHVRLSDTVSDSNSSKGIAATPKMVNDVKSELEEIIDETSKIKDDTTDVKYRLGINNGLIYLEEV